MAAAKKKPSPAETWLARVRKVALALPHVSERPSHGAPSFFFKDKKAFCHLTDNHHGDGRLALWLAGTVDAQQLLVAAEPELFFVPAYVGHLGWIGVRLDRGLSQAKVKALLEQAWKVRAAR